MRRLNSDERGVFIGAFTGDEKILTILSTGEFKLTGYDQSTHFDDEMVSITKFDPDTVISAVYYDGEQGKYFVKRFQVPDNSSPNKPFLFISEGKGSKLTKVSLDYLPRLSFEVKKDNTDHFEYEVVPLADFIAVKSFKAKGKRLSNYTLKAFKLIEPLPYSPPETEEDEDGVIVPEEDPIVETEIDPTESMETIIEENNGDEFKEESPTPPVEVPKPPLPRKKRPEDEPPQLELEF